MDAATLQARIYAGYAKAAAKIGYNTDQYRPTSAANPLASGNKLRTLPASYNAEDLGYNKPNSYGKATWYGLFDGRLTQAGDYLTNTQNGTYFIAAQQSNLPILLVNCNAIADIIRPQQQAGVGVLGYGGDTDATETALMQQWPCSILQGGGGGSAVKLPGDTSDPRWTILVPAYGTIAFRSGDIIKDNHARRYAILSAEKTDLGWRIAAQQEQT